MTKLTREQRINAVLLRCFPNGRIGQIHYSELLTEYAASRLAPPHMLEELETLDEGKIYSCIWEAMLFRHLSTLGYILQNHSGPSGQNGPDFCFEKDGKTIWVEAVVPAPKGVPEEYLAPPKRGEAVVKTKPDESRVLRCSSCISDKMKKFRDYRSKGIVRPEDCTVIAVNICRLSDWDPDGLGLSQLPLVMEAVYPTGPIGFSITPDGKSSDPQHTSRSTLAKRNGQDIPIGYFLDPGFSGVSAILQAHQPDMYQRPLVLAAVHNPLAAISLPHHVFDAGKEFVARDIGDHYEIDDIMRPTS